MTKPRLHLDVDTSIRALQKALCDPDFPGITYRRGASRQPTPVLRSTGLRVQTIAIDTEFGMTPGKIADEYDIPEIQVREAFYEAHRAEIDAAIEAEEALAPK